MNRELLINLVPVGAGGGMQNALSFLSGLSGRADWRDRAMIVCRSGSPLDKACARLGLSHRVVPNTIAGRLDFELRGAHRLTKEMGARVVFTLFGGRPWRSPRVRSISGFAFSFIIQSDVPFWAFLPPHRRLIQGLKDRLRLAHARLADTIILETDYLAERARGGVFADRCVEVVRMEPSALVLNSMREASQAGSTIDLLALASAHPNKRIHLLAPTLARLNASSKGSPNYRLIVTLPEKAAYTRMVEGAFSEAGASAALHNIGPVAPEAVGSLLGQVHAVVNVSLLESFSNNWVEAWASKLPLISTDAEWARASCGEAAIYVDPTKPEEAAERIGKGLSDPERRQLIEAGQAQLDALASEGSKLDRYLRIIERELVR